MFFICPHGTWLRKWTLFKTETEKKKGEKQILWLMEMQSSHPPALRSLPELVNRLSWSLPKSPCSSRPPVRSHSRAFRTAALLRTGTALGTGLSTRAAPPQRASAVSPPVVLLQSPLRAEATSYFPLFPTTSTPWASWLGSMHSPKSTL